MSRSIPGLRTSSPGIPGTPSSGTRSANVTKHDRFEILDDDLDELAESVLLSSSPYFTQPTQILGRTTQPTQIVGRTTQPTQIINRTTQPTQIVERGTTLHRSSPPVPDTPGSVVEVPASSPFRAESQQRRPLARTTPPVAKTGQAGGRLASLMAPAGTAFRAPPSVAAPRRPQPAIKRQYLSKKLSDEDLAKDYKRHDSSDDEDRTMRGEIRPSSFVKKTAPFSKPGLIMGDKELELNDIPDMRLRYLTKQTHKTVVKVKPEITVKQCRDALQEYALSAQDAITSLIGEVAVKTSRETAPLQPTTKSWTQTKLFSMAPKNRDASSSPPPSPEPAKNTAPRRRLMKGRRNRTPSPEKVFSVPSSHPTSSAVTTPTSSAEPAIKMRAADDLPQSQDVVDRRRGPAQGSRKRPHSAVANEVILLDSDSSDDSDLPELSTFAAGAKRRKTTASPQKLPEKKQKRGRLVNRATKMQKKPSPKSKEDSEESEASMTDIETASSKAGSGDDDDEDGDEKITRPSGQHDQVLKYLNGCSAEELARMTGSSLKDSQLVIAKRPFQDIDEVQHVKIRSGKKSKQDDVGMNMVYKLDTWFKAFASVTAVIDQCEERGRQLQTIMSKWEMDRNGNQQDAEDSLESLKRLPVMERPALMADDVQLKSYQLYGLNWMDLLHRRKYGAILADDMGLGKTCQVISFISHLVKTKPHAKPNIIVVPPSTLENWGNEFDRFAPDVSVFLYTGTDRRDLSIREAKESHVVLTSYSMIERQFADIVWLSKLQPYAGIFDEGHKLKNPKALVYKHLSRLPLQWRLVLTGTPVQNNLKELLSLLSFIEPSLFEGNVLEDMNTLFEAKVPNKDVLNFAALAKERVASARTIMVPFILQRRKDEVLELPKKTDRLITLPMTGAQKVLYEEIKATYLQGGKRAGSSKDKGNVWQQLRKAAIHPQLFRRHFTDKVVQQMTDILWKKCSAAELNVQEDKPDKHKRIFHESLLDGWDFSLHLWCKEFPRYVGQFDVPDRSWTEAPKVRKLLDLVQGYQANGDRCLVFSRYEMVIDILRETFAFAGIEYCELTGRSSVSERFPEIDRFNKHPEIPVFLLTTGAGGTGLNLTAANKIIIFDQSDNPQDDVQASNRAHRIGQTREVEVIHLITENTVEGLIYNSCVKKLMLAASVEGRVSDDETVEEECRRKMLLGDDENIELELPPSQQVTLE